MGVENRNPPEQLPIVLQVSFFQSAGLAEHVPGKELEPGTCLQVCDAVALSSARWLSGDIRSLRSHWVPPQTYSRRAFLETSDFPSPLS